VNGSINDSLDDLLAGMLLLRRAMRGVPAEAQGFKAAHDRLARSVASLSIALDEMSTALGDAGE
jgi:hypothetical protein